jgi:hypothetical protein
MAQWFAGVFEYLAVSILSERIMQSQDYKCLYWTVLLLCPEDEHSEVAQNISKPGNYTVVSHLRMEI